MYLRNTKSGPRALLELPWLYTYYYKHEINAFPELWSVKFTDSNTTNAVDIDDEVGVGFGQCEHIP